MQLSTDKYDGNNIVSGLAIKLDGCANVSVYHNTIVGAKHSLWIPDSGGSYLYSQAKTLLWGDNGTGYGAGSHTGVDNLLFQNNLFVNITDGFIGSLDSAKGNATISNNGFFNAGTAIPGGLNDVNGDPLFDTGGSNIYALKAGSPMIDAGIVIPGVTVADGQPDIGAYEYGAPGRNRLMAGLKSNLGVRVFPNPFRGAIKILFRSPQLDGEAVLKLFNVSGRLVQAERILLSNRPGLVLSWEPKVSFPAGTYFIQIQSRRFRDFQTIIKQ